ncbi:hypothetical protein LXL04_018975 [Taraxacum kok-saghyz]
MDGVRIVVSTEKQLIWTPIESRKQPFILKRRGNQSQVRRISHSVARICNNVRWIAWAQWFQLQMPTRTRIEVLRRRAEAKQRFLKEDLAKLLANGLDVNAYGRTEDFIGGLNLLSCYNFIDQSCEYILKQLSVMQKLGQCPEECRETVASLMFAAARFSDLPELRDLRDVFQDRYGNGLECYVNQVFVDKLASKPPVVEKRIKLLQDIAAEFSIHWDSKGFQQRMDSPSTIPQEQVRKFVPPNLSDDKYKVQNGKERIVEGPPLHKNGNVNFRRQVVQVPIVEREEKHSIEKIKHDIPFMGRDEKRGHKLEGYLSKTRPESDSNNIIRNKTRLESDSDNNVIRSRTRPESDSDNNIIRNNRMPSTSYRTEVKEDVIKSTQKVQEEEKEKEPISLLKPPYNKPPPPPYIKSNIPPPYTKPNTHHQPPPPAADLPPPSSGRRNKDHNNDLPLPLPLPLLPKPRSVRRKHSKSSSSHDEIGSSEDSRIVRRMYSSRRKERKGLEILFDDEHYEQKDEEEKMMDKLLLHYSKKPTAYDGKLRKKKSSKSPVNDDEVEMEGNVVPMRSISLPHESEIVPKKVYARANSFQPDNQAAHVHPKLPDYDDLAARFAALRGR